jgi:hypothetical protein
MPRWKGIIFASMCYNASSSRSKRASLIRLSNSLKHVWCMTPKLESIWHSALEKILGRPHYL